MPTASHETATPPRSGFLGILMLDTQFPRPPGDVGNAETFIRHGIPTRLLVVQGASPERIVKQADRSFLQPFVDGAVQLVQAGAGMITTSCGFLAAYQDLLANAVNVPVVTSSLLQCRNFARPGVITIDSAALTQRILDSVGVAPGTPVQGVEPGSEFHRRILKNELQLDFAEAEKNVVDAALRLIGQHPEVEDIVLECTNMPPYRDAVARATGKRVHDIETLLVARWAATL